MVTTFAWFPVSLMEKGGQNSPLKPLSMRESYLATGSMKGDENRVNSLSCTPTFDDCSHNG
jgi:hypothetical protein